MYRAGQKSVQVMTAPLKEGPGARGTNPWESFLCPFQRRVSPWTFHLVRLIICKKGTLKLSCASQLNTSRTEASMWEGVLERLSPPCSFPTPACLIHHIKTVPSSKASQVTHLLKDPPLTSCCFQAEIWTFYHAIDLPALSKWPYLLQLKGTYTSKLAFAPPPL